MELLPELRSEDEGRGMTETTYSYGQYCWFRLPCGICTRTNQHCPVRGGTVEITCTSAGTSISVNASEQAERKEE